MTNAGVTDPNGAIIYLVLLLIPTAVSVLIKIISMINIEKQVSIQSVNSDICVQRNFITEEQKTENTTKNEIKETAIQALTSLGFKTRQAKDLVAKLCINKCYLNESDLLADCFAKNEK